MAPKHGLPLPGEHLMRLTSVLLLTLFMVFTAPACSEEEAPADGAATEEGAEKAEEGDEKKAEEGDEKKADEGDDKKAEEGDEKKAEEGDEKKAEGEPEGEPAAADVKPKVSEEECKAACAHITTMTMSSLPAETKEEAKAKISEALKERCPADCLKHGTPESMKCVMAAKSAADLAACPK